MKIEVGLTPIGRNIVILMGVVVLVLAALAAQFMLTAGPLVSLEAGPDRVAVGERVGYVPLFTQAREGVSSVPAAADANISRLPLYTALREGSAPVLAGDRSLTFTQAREQWFGASSVGLSLFTETREASRYAPLIANLNVPLFTQAREQGSGVMAATQPRFTLEREASGYTSVNADRNLPLYSQAREQEYGAKIAGSPLFTQAREG